VFDQLTALVVDAAASPLVYLVLFALCLVDGFFPPMPSEAALTAVAAIAATTGNPVLAAVLAVAAAGAIAGDQVAYWIGRRGGLARLADPRRPRLARTFAWAERQMRRRSASLILVGRYIPGVRVAVNMVAGATRLPYRKFLLLSGFAGIAWSASSVAISLAASSVLDQPLVAALVSMVAAAVFGVVVDRVIARFGPEGRRARRVRRAAGRTLTEGDARRARAAAKGAVSRT
jgi:membrane protein DedA with SNARE-associated domain